MDTKIKSCICGRRIRKCRKSRGLTQLQLAELCGFGEQKLRSFEKGMRHPSLSELQRIASILGTTPTKLCSRSSEEIEYLKLREEGERKGIRRYFTLLKEGKLHPLYNLEQFRNESRTNKFLWEIYLHQQFLYFGSEDASHNLGNGSLIYECGIRSCANSLNIVEWLKESTIDQFLRIADEYAISVEYKSLARGLQTHGYNFDLLRNVCLKLSKIIL